MTETDWFGDHDELLEELRRSDAGGFIPGVPGYELLVEIARGGQGAVYRARQSGTGRVVAIKALFEGAASVSARRERFERELELAASLEHPGIVRVYDGGSLPDGRLYAVMEYVEGLTLDRFVASSAMTTTELVSLFRNVCEIISFAHRRGVIHRDLKPGNIVVDVDGRPHVLDFGIARATGEMTPATKTGEFVGTLAYASPEQVGGRSDGIDTRTDIYSLGMILYRLLTGHPPYAVDGPIANIVTAIQTAEPKPPSSQTSQSDRELDSIVARCLEKDPDDRYQSVAALVDDLRRYLSGEVLEARRDQTWYVLKKLVHKHRPQAAMVVAGLAFLMVFSAIVTSLWQRAVGEEQKTREINVFWEDTLGSVSASQPNQPITFQDVLDEAVHWVAITTEDRPEVEASLRTTIGNGYRNIGLFDKAESQLQQSLAIRRRLFGENNFDTIQSLNSIGLLRKSQGRLDDASRLFARTLKAREQLLGQDHPAVAMSLQSLGRVAMESGQFELAANYFDRALVIRRRHFDINDPAMATVYFNQGDLAQIQGDLPLAIENHRRALEIRQARLLPGHPDIARSLIALGQVFVEAGQSAEAQQLAREALEVRQSTLPGDHVLVQDVRQWIDSLNEQ